MTTMEGMKSYCAYACMIAAVNMKGGCLVVYHIHSHYVLIIVISYFV